MKSWETSYNKNSEYVSSANENLILLMYSNTINGGQENG